MVGGRRTRIFASYILGAFRFDPHPLVSGAILMVRFIALQWLAGPVSVTARAITIERLVPYRDPAGVRGFRRHAVAGGLRSQARDDPTSSGCGSRSGRQ